MTHSVNPIILYDDEEDVFIYDAKFYLVNGFWCTDMGGKQALAEATEQDKKEMERCRNKIKLDRMRKEDFKAGQTAYVYLVGNAARGKHTDEERIEEWTVSSVGRKYITIKNGCGREEKFNIENNFRHVYSCGSENYVLYPTEGALRLDLWRRNKRKIIQKCVSLNSGIWKKLSDEELKTVCDIFKRCGVIK